MENKNGVGRPGVTRQDVRRALDVLAEKDGKKDPTIEAIRIELGTGSDSTILAHLRAIRAENEMRAKPRGLSFPPEVVAPLLEHVQGLLAAQAVEHSSEIARQDAQLGAMCHEKDALSAQLAELETLRASERSEREQLGAKLQAITDDARDYLAKVVQLTECNGELKAELAAAQHELGKERDQNRRAMERLLGAATALETATEHGGTDGPHC